MSAEFPRDTTDGNAVPPPQSVWRYSLLTMMSATAVIAVWVAYFLTLEESKRMELELPGLRDISRELFIQDAQKFAAVRHHELSHDDFRWRVYLPPDAKYLLNLATQNHKGPELIQGPKPVASIVAPIEAGEHELTLVYEKRNEEWVINVSVDGQILMSESQPPEWNPGHGSAGGSNFDRSRQHSTEKPLELFDLVFNIPQAEAPGAFLQNPDAPRSFSTQDSETGVRLWIEKLEPKPKN